MITNSQIGIMGRFGNQMFQYASLYGIAKNNGYDYGIPYFRKSKNEKEHMCLPDCFLNLTAKDSSHKQFKYQIFDADWCFNEKYLKISDDTDILGYFQSEKYFKKYKAEIINEFDFKEEIKKKANTFFEDGSEIISLHIRLGDYVNLQNIHPVCKIEYYEKAIENLPEKLTLSIFTDDLDNAKKIFKNKFKDKKIIYIDSNDKFVDMCLMTRCSYHIIANSTFSWWGAWLSKSKKVIAPEQWFGVASALRGKHHDIYCDNWEVI